MTTVAVRKNRRPVRWGRLGGQAMTYIAVVVALGIMLLPIIWLFLTSIRPLVEITTTQFNFWPNTVTWDNYVDSFARYDVFIYIKNSIIICIGVVAANLVLGLPAAYALARYSFHGERPIFSLLIVLRMIPLIAVMVPLFLIFSNLGLMDTYASLILAHTAFKLPVTIWLLRAFIIDIPRELDDSARVDGCSIWGLILRITLPLVRPGLAATAVLSFLFTWNDLLVSLVLSNSIDTQMIALGLTKFVLEYGVAWGPLTAAGMLIFIPTLIFVFVAERYLVSGLTIGSVNE